jgi:hypothetical protein
MNSEQQRIVAKVDELMRWCDALEARLTTQTTTAELEPCSPPFFRLRYASPRQATAPSPAFM